MPNGRALGAHFAATVAAAIVLFIGFDVLTFGPTGVLSGPGKSIGGFLVILLICTISVPLGLALRYLVGKLPLSPRPVAVAAGIAVGLALIPILHPGMIGGISFTSNPLALIVIHGLAGCVGGMIWHAAEFRNALRVS
jgi:hypothetical protein